MTDLSSLSRVALRREIASHLTMARRLSSFLLSVQVAPINAPALLMFDFHSPRARLVLGECWQAFRDRRSAA